jgi:two-component system, response regulator YesN
MFTVMIVEDSKPILRNIQQQIEKTDSQVIVTRQAYNGVEALEILKKTDIDILFTDIRMPKMDGLTLIEEALKINPNVKTVLLTGYNDFEHARRAIQLNVSDYLLKPLDPSELKRVLSRIIGELQRERRESNDIWLAACLRQEAKTTKNPFNTKRYLLTVIRQGVVLPSPHDSVEQGTPHNVCSSVFCSSFFCTADGHNNTEKVVYIPLEETITDVSEKMGSFFDQLLGAHSVINVAYCLGNQDTDSIKSLYLKLSAFVSSREVLSKSNLFHWKNEEQLPLEMTENEKEQLKLKYQSFMKSAQQEPSIESFREIMYAGEDEPLRRCQSRFELFFRTIAKMAGIDDIEETDIDLLIRRSPSYLAATDNLFHRLFLPLYHQSNSARNTAHETLASIDSYFQANLYGNITLQDLSNELNYSSSYIIRVFKKYRGVTPMEYFTKLKIDEAKKLIKENDFMLMKDIAEAMHFYDQHHFAKVFKQYTNESPSDFRRKVSKR